MTKLKSRFGFTFNRWHPKNPMRASIKLWCLLSIKLYHWMECLSSNMKQKYRIAIHQLYIEDGKTIPQHKRKTLLHSIVSHKFPFFFILWQFYGFHLSWAFMKFQWRLLKSERLSDCPESLWVNYVSALKCF